MQAQDGAELVLAFGLTFQDLYERQGLLKLDGLFLDELRQAAPELSERLLKAREEPPAPHNKTGSELIIELAPYVDDFVGKLFGIDDDLARLQSKHSELAPLYAIKRKFVQRKALTGFTVESASEIDGFSVGAVFETLMAGPLTELGFSTQVARWLENETAYHEHLRVATLYAAWATLSPQGKARHGHGVLFKIP